MTVRCFCQELLALLAPAVRARHGRVCAGFIDKDQPVEVQTGLCCLPELARQGDIRPPPLIYAPGIDCLVAPARKHESFF